MRASYVIFQQLLTDLIYKSSIMKRTMQHDTVYQNDKSTHIGSNKFRIKIRQCSLGVSMAPIRNSMKKYNIC